MGHSHFLVSWPPPLTLPSLLPSLSLPSSSSLSFPSPGGIRPLTPKLFHTLAISLGHFEGSGVEENASLLDLRSMEEFSVSGGGPLGVSSSTSSTRKQQQEEQDKQEEEEGGNRRLRWRIQEEETRGGGERKSSSRREDGADPCPSFLFSMVLVALQVSHLSGSISFDPARQDWSDFVENGSGASASFMLVCSAADQQPCEDLGAEIAQRANASTVLNLQG
jgi:hypothetical protein